MFKMEKPCAAKVDIELGGVEKVINRNKSNNAMCDVNGVNLTSAIASPSSYQAVGHGWLIVSYFPSLSAVVAGVWTQVDPCGPCGPRWTMWTQVDPAGPR